MTSKKKKQGADNPVAKHRLPPARLADPFHARESANYEFPMPSREYVVSCLQERAVPLDLVALCEAVGVREHELSLFMRRLRAMERDGELVRNRRGDYLLPDKADLVRGRVEGHPDGFGFLIREDGGADIFLGPAVMREVLHGDRIIARVTGKDRKGRPEGGLVEVLTRGNQTLVGRLIKEHGLLTVVPEDRRIAHDVLVPGKPPKRARPGDVVVVALKTQPARHARPTGEIIEVLGSWGDPGMEIEIALRKHDLPFLFSAEVKAEMRSLPREVRRKDRVGREDLRGLPLVTIDGETARDFDDAVYCERQGKGFRLVVAVADVSHYVAPGSALDQSAAERGNSVYFPRRVIPMLPEKLSNGLCSLNPEVERLCLVADMQLSARGEVRHYRFYPAVMYSHARLTYNEVAAALYEDDAAAQSRCGSLLGPLRTLDAAFRALLGQRARRGAIDFETTETRMIFGDDGKIVQIVPESRNDAHRLIEECMLAANVCAADFLAGHEHPLLYRVHEGPTEEKLARLRAYLVQYGLELSGGDEPQAKDYAKLMKQVQARPDAALLQVMLLRSLQQARYSPENLGHFGLAYDAYAHFTSPIRRYPDLLVHRAIKAVLTGTTYQPGDWAAIGATCSATERRADDATREVEAWLKCFYMQGHLGESFAGTVVTVVPFGLFVVLDALYVEGLVHISELGGDYFHFDEVRHEMSGSRTRQRYRMGDRLEIRVARVDLERQRIEFQLVGRLRDDAQVDGD